jgi:hypothetical protein
MKSAQSRTSLGDRLAIGAAFLSNIASVAAVAVAIQALKVNTMDQQAWITPQGDFAIAMNDPNKISSREHFTNIGRTPANNVEIGAYSVGVAPSVSTEQLIKTIEKYDKDHPPQPAGDIAPNEPLTHEDMLNPQQSQQFENMFTNGYTWYFRVRIKYFDIFGHEHHTYTCTKVNASGLNQWVYGFCPQGTYLGMK